jgi:TetR/AcrR family transcriptional regulator, transcriptional repressor for nem operon
MARAKEFDEQAVIESSMKVFWELGYDGASMEELLSATGLSRSSLYESFGDKRSLFLRTVEAYTARSGDLRRAAFGDPSGLRAGLTRYLRSRTEALANAGDRPAGCYVTMLSASLKSADQELRDIVASYTAGAEREIREGFERALAAGSIQGRLTAEEWTNLFLALTWGLNVAARMGRPRASLDAMVNGFIACLGE